MTPETCAVLTGAFPLILIAVVADRRVISPKLRRLRSYRWLFINTVAACLIGLACAVIGVQLHGFELFMTVFVWGLFAVALSTFGISVLMRAATLEAQEDLDAVAERDAEIQRNTPQLG